MRWRSWTGEIVNLIDFELIGIANIVPNQLKTWVAEQVLDVALSTCEEIVQAQHFMAFIEESFAEMGTEKSGTAGD
jgi:hypothetical protein